MVGYLSDHQRGLYRRFDRWVNRRLDGRVYRWRDHQQRLWLRAPHTFHLYGDLTRTRSLHHYGHYGPCGL